MEKIRIFEAFSGYGSQSIALRNIGIPYEIVGISEVDKYAIKAYESIHGKVNNLGDIRAINLNNIPEHDLFTYSFPCTDLAKIGKEKGMKKGSGTHSSLLYECEKIIKKIKPKYLLLENVTELLNDKNKCHFNIWETWLNQLGYKNFTFILNSKEFGIPQFRKRVFMVSILNCEAEYQVPSGTDTDKKIRDILQDDVDNKYILSDLHQTRFRRNLNNADIMNDLPTRGYLKVCGTSKDKSQLGKKQRFWVHDIDGMIGALTATDYKQPRQILMSNGTIRKLTPHEYFRLMGLDEEDIYKIQGTGISDTQQYKMAGNSIVVNVLEEIFRNLFSCKTRK